MRQPIGSFIGNSGVYSTAHTRICSILRKSDDITPDYMAVWVCRSGGPYLVNERGSSRACATGVSHVSQGLCGQQGQVPYLDFHRTQPASRLAIAAS